MSIKDRWAKLDENKNVIPCSLAESCNFTATLKNKVVKQETLNGLFISTVFLGLNHAFRDEPPLWFETMVFPEGTYSDIYGDRYETYQQAVDGHEAAKQKVINGEIKAENEAL